MKKIFRFMSIALAAAFTMVSASSCDLLEDLLDALEDETTYESYPSGWSTQDDKLVYKTELSSATYIFEFEFADGECTKAYFITICPDAATAQIVYAALDSETKDLTEVDGKLLITDVTDVYSGLSENLVREAVKIAAGDLD